MPITHVSDTARWVAVYRAMESERPDALFNDPFARRLAGPKGEEIVRSLDRGVQAAWSMIVRTVAIDEILMRLVRDEGVECVLNFAAGLDARPFRLDLPSSLDWIDVDFADVLDYKWEVLRDATARCRYHRVPADLSDANARRAVLERVASQYQRVLVVAEGLLIYLDPADVLALARDLQATAPCRWWIIDIANPQLLQWMQRSWGKSAAQGNAPFKFAPAEGTAFFAPAGWRELEFRSSFHEGIRLNRAMRGAWLWRIIGRLMSKRRRAMADRMAGVALLGRG